MKTSELIDERRIEFSADDLRDVLSRDAGRRIFQHMFDMCRVNANVWAGNALIHALAGTQEFGLQMKREIEKKTPDLYLLMEQERLQHDDDVVKAQAEQQEERKGRFVRRRTE